MDIDLNKYPNNREFAKFISQSRLRSLKVRNYSTEDDALNSLICLANCQTLQEFSIHFSTLAVKAIERGILLPKNAQKSIKKLQI